ncbi:MAG: GNAT family N-acetyltransferase, partial [Vicinamibacterales bacterium]
VASLLAEAFAGDPLINWVLRPDRRQQALRDFFRANVDEYFANRRRVDVATDDGEIQAALLWTPAPGAQPSSPRERLGLWGLRSWTGVRRFPRLARLVIATEARYPRFPHHYVLFIGTRADAQGKGLGSSLLRHVLADCDARGIPAYLESSNSRNLNLYWRTGFRMLEQITLAPGAPPLWLMLREPSPGV